MEAFGIIGMSMGTMVFIFALNAIARIDRLEGPLKDCGLLDKGLNSVRPPDRS